MTTNEGPALEREALEREGDGSGGPMRRDGLPAEIGGLRGENAWLDQALPCGTRYCFVRTTSTVRDTPLRVPTNSVGFFCVRVNVRPQSWILCGAVILISLPFTVPVNSVSDRQAFHPTKKWTFLSISFLNSVAARITVRPMLGVDSIFLAYMSIASSVPRV